MKSAWVVQIAFLDSAQPGEIRRNPQKSAETPYQIPQANTPINTQKYPSKNTYDAMTFFRHLWTKTRLLENFKFAIFDNQNNRVVDCISNFVKGERTEDRVKISNFRERCSNRLWIG